MLKARQAGWSRKLVRKGPFTIPGWDDRDGSGIADAINPETGEIVVRFGRVPRFDLFYIGTPEEISAHLPTALLSEEVKQKILEELGKLLYADARSSECA